jgi:hypothetical protein
MNVFPVLIEIDMCEGCEYHNAPYWSIINPCDNCYKKYHGAIQYTYTTTGTPNSRRTCRRYASTNCQTCIYNPEPDYYAPKSNG